MGVVQDTLSAHKNVLITRHFHKVSWMVTFSVATAVRLIWALVCATFLAATDYHSATWWATSEQQKLCDNHWRI